ncbi:MAG: sulfur relay protein DsrC [Gammaproteobacteria bacterium]|nr:sulfur relay protein DsrC [Gammaproteobacteria bacterium]MCP5135888.1 sulfur relay protein DsrC [Gammaproteobacteria bacterium]
MLWLSEVLIQHHELQNFDELVVVIRDRAHNGELFFRMDVKPPFTDTPDDWEDRLESAFTSAVR